MYVTTNKKNPPFFLELLDLNVDQPTSWSFM